MPVRNPSTPTPTGLALLKQVHSAGGRLTVRKFSPGGADRHTIAISTIHGLEHRGYVTFELLDRGFVQVDITADGLAYVEGQQFKAVAR